jgi:hypothetical protein
MKTKTKILKVFAIVAIFLGNSHLMAQNSSLSTQTVCVGDIEPYTLVDPVNGPPAVTSTYQWSTTGGVIVGGISTGDNIDINWTTVGVYTVSVVATDIATGCQDSPIDVEVTVEDLANAPIVPNPPPICLNDLNPTMTASTGGGTGNSVFNWYADNLGAPGTLLLANSVSYTDPTPYSIVTTYSYWVTEESANGCEGTATMVTVTVTPLPTAPTLVSSPYAACFGDPTNPLMTAVGSGSNFNWYEEDLVTPGTPGAQVATNSNTYTSTEVNISTYTYFVEEVVGSCTSPQTTFTFTIHTPPAAPSITPDPIEICEGDVPGNFTANTGGAGGTFTWYSNAALTNVIPGAATCTPTEVLQGIYFYYLTETDPTTTCISSSSQATFEIFELPLQPTVSANPSAIICEGQATPVFTAATAGGVGTGTFTWYDASMTQVGTGVTYTPSQTVAGGPWTFFVTETNSITNCEGPTLSFTFEIVALPAAPTLIPNPVEICFGDVNPPFIPTGVSSAGANLIWYDDVALTSQVGTGATFTAPGTVVGNAASVTTYSYWVIDQPGNCVSPALQVDLQINPLPTPGPIWHN